MAVDPSSPFSGGAILGDRVRMNEAAEANQAFVRSMATRGHLGGLAPSTLQAVDILDAAGYSPDHHRDGRRRPGRSRDRHCCPYSRGAVCRPGLGDDIQAIKAGILEIADIHVVSKADKPEAAAAVAALKGMLALGAARAGSTWTPPVLAVSSVSGEHMESLKAAIGNHWKHLQDSGELAARQRNNCRTRIFNTARHLFQQQFDERAEDLEKQLQAVVNREADPQAAAQVLLGWNKEGRK